MDELDVFDRRADLLELRRQLKHVLATSGDARTLPSVSKELRAVNAELDALPSGEEETAVDGILTRRAGRTSHLRAVAAGED